MDWCGADDVVLLLDTVDAKDCSGLIMDSGYELKNWYFEDAGVTVEIFELELVTKESFSFVSKSRIPVS